MTEPLVAPPRYALEARLGGGGGGEVWSARDRLTGAAVALKVLREGAGRDEALALVREVTTLSGLEGVGPKVLRFGMLEPGHRAYLVRELVPGVSLEALIASPACPPERALLAVARTADALTALHRAGLLHGDVKPANLIVDEGDRVGLIDLGLSTRLASGGAPAHGLTPRYAAPELFEGRPLTVRAEVYALGATLREAVRTLGPRMPAELLARVAEVAEAACATLPEARYPTADELGAALRTAANLTPDGDPIAPWRIVDLDPVAADAVVRIARMPSGAGLVLAGPPGSGRSTLLRRLAWELGVRGERVAWLDAADRARADQALELELAAAEPATTVVLADDADLLPASAQARLSVARATGARLVVVTGAGGFDGPTFDVFALPPLASAEALVQLRAPGLGQPVVDHLLALSGSRPGPLRAALDAIGRRPVVQPSDVDALLRSDRRARTSASVHELLDRGHFDEAAELLAELEGDPSPMVAIARARLATNRGEAALALLALEAVRSEADSSPDPLVPAAWRLHAARAHLRKGEYPAARELASQAATAARAPRAPRSARAIEVEATAVAGLAEALAGDHAAAEASLSSAVELARKLGEPRALAVALGSQGFGLQRQERLDAAREAYEQALTAAEQAGDAGSVATTRLNLASIAQTQGEVGHAIVHLEAAVDMGRRSGRVATLRQALLNLAGLELYVGRFERARASIASLTRQRDELPAQQRAQLVSLEAELAARTGDPAAALALCAACAEHYEALGRRGDAAEARLERVLLGASFGASQPADLAADVAHAERLLEGSHAHQALLELARGAAAERSDSPTRARAQYDSAITRARASGQLALVVRGLEARSQLQLREGAVVTSGRDAEEALAVLETMASKLPADLRDVFWGDPRRAALRAAFERTRASSHAAMASAARSAHAPPSARGPRVSAHLAPSSTLEERLARLLEINRAIAGEHHLPRLLERITDAAVGLLGAERGFVLLRSGFARGQEGPTDAISVHASRGEQGDDAHARFSRGIADRVLATREPVVTTSARDDERMAGYVSVHQLALQSVACVPILARGGAAMGALYLETRLRPGASFEADLPVLVALADQVAISIETARLLGENERRAVELETKNRELEKAHADLAELLGHRTAQLAATRRDLRTARAVLRGHFGYAGVVGTSEAMRRVYAIIDRVKDTNVPVLLTGESGTGKEVVARAIHDAGPRAKKPFLGINCGAIPEHLLESELFGHVRGAFTGADRDRRGLFREAHEGTLLLDEIGEMPHKMQAGLLRVLQERVVRPVGSAREEPTDTRVIVATHRDLHRMVAEGRFREDLLYRLDVIHIRVPPLRERAEDIPALIDHFLGIFASRYHRERRTVSRVALRALSAHPWPGNVRQLENVLLNAWVLSDREELELDDFDLPDARSAVSMRPASVPTEALAAAQVGGPTAPHEAAGAVRQAETSLASHKAGERERMLEALAASNWNRLRAAELVGMPRRTFYRRLKEYGIQ